MSYVSALARNAQAVGITPGSGSYFSQPSEVLDPRLFEADRLRLTVRESILQLLFDHLDSRYVGAESWAHVWLAGSGVSYQWEAAREPGDLDCLVGVEYESFRRANPDYTGLGNEEIAKMFNENFNIELWPRTSNFMGAYELTFYVNPQTNILDINPYAAYDLIHDSWTVEPDKHQAAPQMRQWDQQVTSDYTQAVNILKLYTDAVNQVRNATNTAHRVNAERTLSLAVDQASDLFDVIHAGRKTAFSMVGQGYGDWHNFRWQAGKKNGSIQALRKIKDYRDEALASDEAQTYGIELPDAHTLTRRAATRRVGH